MILPYVNNLGSLQLLMGQVFQQFYLYYTFIWGVQLHIDGGGSSEQLFGLKLALYTEQLNHLPYIV